MVKVVYALRDGNEHVLFVAFDEEAAETALAEAEADMRFGKVGRDVGFAVQEDE